jgi:hypothetical protein
MIPHGLEQATGGEHALVQTELGQAIGKFCVYWIGHCDPDQAFDSQCHHPFSIDQVLATDNTANALQIREIHRPFFLTLGQSGANHASFNGMKSVATMWMTLLK